MKKLLIVLALSLSTLSSHAQGVCGTEDPPQQVYDFLESLDFEQLKMSRRSDTTLNVPIQLHMMRSSTGASPLSPADIFAAICTMNERYTNANINFYIKNAPIYYDSNQLLNPSATSVINTLMGNANVPYVMNVYFANMGSLGLNGYAYYPNSGPGSNVRQGGLVMSYSAVMNGATLSHETGHYLSLPHPFNQTSNNKLMGERVTRNFNEILPRQSANCYLAGDRFCDTQADFKGSRWGCTHSPAASDTDLNGDFFRPDSSLLMSYAGDACRTRLTEEQMIACREVLENIPQRGYLLVFPMPVLQEVTQAPTLTLPAEGSTGWHPDFTTFRWSAVPGATMYRLRALSNGVVLDIDTLLYDTVYFHGHNKLKANRNYSWEVTAFNQTDLCGNPTSARGTFTTVSFTTTSVAENHFGELKVYPNLLDRGQAVRIEANALVGKTLRIELRSADGKLVQLQQHQALEDSFDFETGLQAAGIYFMTIENEGYKIVRKLVQR